MLDFWDKELTEEETDALLRKAYDEISKRHMVIPAILALEMHKPLAFVGANAMVAAGPFMAPFFGFDSINDFSRLFSKRENVERLIKMLETSGKKD